MTVDRRSHAPVGHLLLAAVLVLLLTAMATPAAATGPPQSGSGTGFLTDEPEITSERTAGRNSIQERTLTVQVEGTLDGELVQHVRGVVHDGRFVTFQGTATFTGEMEGCGEGTLTLGIAGKGSAGDHPVTEASVRVIRKGANTIPARGVGTVFQDGPVMTYELQYVC